MEDKQLVESISQALRGAGFSRLQRRESSRSLTISAEKGARSVVVHFADKEPPLGPRLSINADIPALEEIVVRARVPGMEGRSGAGGSGHPKAPVGKRRRPRAVAAEE